MSTTTAAPTPTSTTAFADLPTIGLPDLLARAELQTRVDRKYLVPVSALAALPAADPEMMVLEVGGLTRHAYASRYEDTAERDSYLLSAHARPARYKVRTRTYCDTGAEYLEVKTRSRRGETVKDRLPLETASRRDANRFVPRTIRERTGMELPGREELAPVLDVHYDRTTLYLPSSGSRATVDENLTWTDLETGARLGLEGLAIVETKSPGHPSPLDRHLWRLGHRPLRLSKFACGAALLGDLPANRWHRTLTRLQPHLSAC